MHANHPKPAITLIGMPGSGKSTIGVLLAKILAKPFMDTDLLLQEQLQCALQKYIDTHGFMEMRQQEAKVILNIAPKSSVIATGGSSIYSEDAMRHLASFSDVYYLRISFALMRERLGDYSTRGIAFPKHGSLEDMYDERAPFYERFADVTLSANKSTTSLCQAIFDRFDGAS